MKRGFTLIELLAVITVLGLLATLISSKIINDIAYSKEEGVKNSIETAYNAAEEYYYSQDGIKNKTIDLTSKTIKLNGTLEKGEVYFDNNGNIKLFIYKDGYCALKSFVNDYVSVKKSTKEDCNISNVDLMIAIKRTNQQVLTPRINVSWNNIRKIELTAKATLSTYNILLAKHTGQWIGATSSSYNNWTFSGMTATSNITFPNFANGNFNTAVINITSGGASSNYITIGWDAVWNKECYYKKIKFYGANDEVLADVIATDKGKFYDNVSGKYLDNYTNCTSTAVISSQNFEYVTD